MRIYFVFSSVLFVATIGLSFSDDSGGRVPSCVFNYLEKNLSSFKQSAARYAEEVRETKGLRLLLKDAPDNTDQKWFGILALSDATAKPGFITSTKSVLQLLPRKISRKLYGESYDLKELPNPNLILNRTVEAISERYGNKKQLTSLFLAPIDFYVGLKLYRFYDQKYRSALRTDYKKQLNRYASFYDSLIQNDYRFNDIRQYLRHQSISVEEGREMAQKMLTLYNNYYRYMQSDYPHEPEAISSDKLLNSPLFVGLSQTIVRGIPKEADGFKKIPNGPTSIDTEIKDELLGINHVLFEKYQMIPEMVRHTEVWRQMQTGPGRKELAEEILSDPYTKTLYSLAQSGKLSQDQLVYRLQEDAYWQSKFQEWNTFGLIRLKRVSGQFTRIPLSLNDIRQESLNEILTGKS